MSKAAILAVLPLLVGTFFLPIDSCADVFVEVPGALGTYVGYGPSKAVTVDFGRPLPSVSALRVRWRGTNTLGLASCDGNTPGAWYCFLHCSIDIGYVNYAHAVGMLYRDGPFELEATFWCPRGCEFLASGNVPVVFSLGDNAVECWEGLQLLVAPRVTLDAVSIVAVIPVPVASSTWSAVKSLYGR